MHISISNIKTLCQQTFEDVVYDNFDNLIQIKQYFQENKSPLAKMLLEEFSFYWNDCFSKKLLTHNFVVEFPKFIKPSLSVFLLNWKDYIEEKYKPEDFSPTYTLREVKLQSLQDEVDKVKSLFQLSTMNIFHENFDSIAQGLRLTVPHYYSATDKDEQDTTFKDSFICGVFYLAKLQSSLYTNVQEDDLQNFLKCYYSYFYKDKISGRDVIFNHTYSKNLDHITVMQKKLDFLQPKTVYEQNLFYQLNIDTQLFAQTLQKIIGVKSYTDNKIEEYSILQLKAFFTSIKVKVLENKMPLRHNMHHKTLKI